MDARLDPIAVKRVLMIAFHFPPFQGSSGIQRTLKFARYLPDHGWEPVVLSAHPRAYPTVSTSQMDEIARLHVRRAPAWDAARHFAIAGMCPPPLAWPDRWATWWLGAVPAGLALVRHWRPQAIWSTFPIATAHLIGLTLARLTGLPWIADFRDSMTEDDYPRERAIRALWRCIERRTLRRSHAAVFTTPGALRMYAHRYPTLPATRLHMIANGYDEEDFANAGRVFVPLARTRRVLLHSGLLYPSERDPTAFFDALADLRDRNCVSADTLHIVFRASGYDDYYRRVIAQRRLSDLVEFAPAVPYHDALSEMLAADGLLIFQAANCNRQIPAKLYEYLRARRPILAVTDPAGDTAATLRAAGIDTIVRLDARADIASGLSDFLARIERGAAPVASAAEVAHHARAARTVQLAHLLDAVTRAPAVPESRI